MAHIRHAKENSESRGNSTGHGRMDLLGEGKCEDGGRE